MEQNDNIKQDRTSQMQRKVLEHLAESGNVSYSCKRAGINRDTFYEWKKEDKLFAHDAALAVEYGKSSVNDLAHSQLIRNIQDGNMQAVRFQLLSCHDDYKPRRARAPEEKEMDEDDRPIAAIILTEYDDPRSSASSSPSRSLVPSVPPERKNKEEKEKPKQAKPTDVKPAAPEPEKDIVQFQRPPARKIWRNNDDDDGVAFDGDIIWGKRGR